MSKTHKKKNASAKPLQQDHPMAARKTLYSLEKAFRIGALDRMHFFLDIHYILWFNVLQ
jgi:hypothetical protein